MTYWYNDQKINANRIKFTAGEESRQITVKITGMKTKNLNYIIS